MLPGVEELAQPKNAGTFGDRPQIRAQLGVPLTTPPFWEGTEEALGLRCKTSLLP